MQRRSNTPIATRASPLRTRRQSRSAGPKRAQVPSSSLSEASTCDVPVPKPQLQRQRSDDSQEAFIRVVARVRPKLTHERRASDGVEVDVGSNSLTLTSSRVRKTFYVDQAFDSRKDQGSQENVFSTFGQDFVKHSLNGYNVCIFAYGHTGSGKSYTMLGDRSSDPAGSQAGILPRFLRELFAAHAQDPVRPVGRRYSCEFYEVYNEQIKDLLVPAKSGERTRKVHVHPKHGVRVENLTMSVVASAEEALRLVEFGTLTRAVAATTMNAHSSRSHAVFTFKYEQQTCDGKSCQSTVTFVDLAGREDQSVSENRAAQFREMCCINTSLFHLATVIHKLSHGSIDGRSLADFRNSKLTLLLSPALIGNSRTALIATVAPLRGLVDDSLCTLNFAASVKKIKSQPVVNNKAPNTLVAELEAEVRQLQSELIISKTGEAEKERALLSAQALISSYKHSWEEALVQSREQDMTRKKSLKSLGLAVQDSSRSSDIGSGLAPFFTKLSDDPAMQGRCNYFLQGETLRLGSDQQNCSIVLQGLGILPQMCEVRMDPSGNVVIELLIREKEGVPRVLVNGYPLLPSDGVRTISHGTCLFLGYSHAFRFVAPTREMALQAASTDACVLAQSTLERLDVTSALAEIVDEAGEQFKDILPYISNLSTRNADGSVQSLMAALHRICPLIDEANLITKEVMGDDGLHFELHALTNIFNFCQDVPELVVCVLQAPGPLAKFRRSVQTVMHQRRQSIDSLAVVGDSDTSHLLGHARHPLVHAMGLSEHMRIGGHALLYVWPLEKFLGRLTGIRDIYQEGSEAKDNFASVRQNLSANPDQNPWREIALGYVQLLKERSTSPPANLDSPRPLSGEELRELDAVSDSISMMREFFLEELVSRSSSISVPPQELFLEEPVPRSSSISVPAALQSPLSEDSCSTSSSLNDGTASTGNLDAVSERSEVTVLPSEYSRQTASMAALGAKIEMLSAQVAQMQLEISSANSVSRSVAMREQADRAADFSQPSSTEPTGQGSEEVTRWLRQVEELRKSAEKLAAEQQAADAAAKLLQNQSSAPLPVKAADNVSEYAKCIKANVLKTLKEGIKLDRASSSDSTRCSSGHVSGRTTPSDIHEGGVVYRPRQRPTSQADAQGAQHRSEVHGTQFGPPIGTLRKPSPAQGRAPLVTQNLGSAPLSSRASMPSLYSKKMSDNNLSSRSRTASKSPARRFIGPYPKLSWAYYEVQGCREL